MSTSRTNAGDAFNSMGQFGRARVPQVVGADVLLVDPVASRRDLISRTIVEAGGTPRVVEKFVSEHAGGLPRRLALVALGNQRWTPSFGQENAEIKLGFQALLD